MLSQKTIDILRGIDVVFRPLLEFVRDSRGALEAWAKENPELFDMLRWCAEAAAAERRRRLDLEWTDFLIEKFGAKFSFAPPGETHDDEETLN